MGDAVAERSRQTDRHHNHRDLGTAKKRKQTKHATDKYKIELFVMAIMTNILSRYTQLK